MKFDLQIRDKQLVVYKCTEDGTPIEGKWFTAKTRVRDIIEYIGEV